MIFTSFKRIVRTGFINFWRNSFISFAAIVVITLSLCAFGGLIFGSAFANTLLASVKEKVDINVYFTLDANESDILAFQKDVNALPEVSTTKYISRDQALADFKDRWHDNALIMQGLTEVGDNPLPAALNVVAKDPRSYAGIVQYIDSKNPVDKGGTPIIDHINYKDNKVAIDHLTNIIPTAERVGLLIAVILIVLAVIVVFNTIRLIIYTARDEISVMKLVGASNTYVRGPFVISGIMYGIVSGLITLVIMAAVAYWSDNLVLRLAGVDVASNFHLIVDVLSTYFKQNFGQIFCLIMGTGIVLGGLSSYIAARRYLKV